MKSTGYVRRLDELGRVVIPMEVRRNLGIGEKDGLEIFIDSERIILRKYHPACVFCGSISEVSDYKGKKVCQSCLLAIAEKAQ